MRMRGLCVLLCVHVVLEREEMGCRILPIALLHVVCVGFFAGGGLWGHVTTDETPQTTPCLRVSVHVDLKCCCLLGEAGMPAEGVSWWCCWLQVGEVTRGGWQWRFPQQTTTPQFHMSRDPQTGGGRECAAGPCVRGEGCLRHTVQPHSTNIL